MGRTVAERVRATLVRSAEGEPAEHLGVADAGGATGLLGAVAQELAELLARLGELARVAEERVDLALEHVADVDPAVRLERPRQVDAAHVVGRETVAQL